MKYSNVELFVSELEDELKKRLPIDLTVKEMYVDKDNGKQRAITFAGEDNYAAPLYYVNNLFETVNNTENGFDELVEEMVARAIEAREHRSENSRLTEQFGDRDFILNNVVAVLVGKSAKERIDNQNLVFIPFHDMYIVFEVEVEVCGQRGTVRINKQMLERSGVTQEELIVCGKTNARDKLGYQFLNLGGFLGMGQTGQFILTNMEMEKGAYSVFYADLKSKAYELGANIVLLPSSIHEWICSADDGLHSASEYRAMVKSVNSTMDTSEVLSETVYYYDRTTGELTEMK